MNAIGEELKAERIAKGLSLEQVSEDTNIARRFLAALEEEDYSVFPGDPYIIGFLRTYSEYLGIDPHAMLQSFRGMRIQEQPVPFEALLPSRKPPVWPFLLVIFVLAGGVLAFFLARNAQPRDIIEEITQAAPSRIVLDRAKLERRFFEEDELIVNYDNRQFSLKLVSIDDRVAIETPAGLMRFMLGEEASVDLDGDNRAELVLFIKDFQKGVSSKGALISITAGSEISLETEEVYDYGSLEEGIIMQASTVADRADTRDFIVFSGKRSPHPFVLNVTFRNYAMFRHEIDRQDRQERYYHKGDQITTTANNSAKIWSSNAASCKVNIQATGGQSVDLELGNPGEIVVKMLRWSQSEDSTWMLALYDVN